MKSQTFSKEEIEEIAEKAKQAEIEEKRSQTEYGDLLEDNDD